MTTNNEQQYAEQLRVLQERFPQATNEKLMYLLKRFNGDADQVRLKSLKTQPANTSHAGEWRLLGILYTSVKKIQNHSHSFSSH